jgi:hypothetical protein
VGSRAAYKPTLHQLVSIKHHHCDRIVSTEDNDVVVAQHSCCNDEQLLSLPFLTVVRKSLFAASLPWKLRHAQETDVQCMGDRPHVALPPSHVTRCFHALVRRRGLPSHALASIAACFMQHVGIRGLGRRPAPPCICNAQHKIPVCQLTPLFLIRLPRYTFACDARSHHLKIQRTPYVDDLDHILH